MINRILIRIKVLQTLYSYYHSGLDSVQDAEEALLSSLQKSYNLYFYLLQLILSVTQIHRHILEFHKHKLEPTEEEKHPNMRLANNRFVTLLESNEELNRYCEENSINCVEDRVFVRSLLDKILASDLYKSYLEDSNDNYETDRHFWHSAFKKLICADETTDDFLLEKCIDWNVDVPIIESFVLKTINQYKFSLGSHHPLLEMYNNDDTKEFAVRLLRLTLINGDKYKEIIFKNVKNWKDDRLADLDVEILQLALSEILNFPTIPISVTMDEYIEYAKYFSTPKSAKFINGILGAIVKEFKSENKLFKN